MIIFFYTNLHCKIYLFPNEKCFVAKGSEVLGFVLQLEGSFVRWRSKKITYFILSLHVQNISRILYRTGTEHVAT